MIVPPSRRAEYRAGMQRLAATGPGLRQRLRLTVMHADGHEFPIDLAVTTDCSGGGPVYHVFCHDVTTVDRIERFAAVEAAIARGLVEATSAERAAQRVVQAIGVNMGWAVTELWLVEDDQQVLRCAARHVAAGQRLDTFAVNELGLGVGLPGRVHEQAQPVWIPDLGADVVSLRSRVAARAGLKLAVGVPICSGQPLGALCIYGHHAEDPQASLTTLLAGIAAQVGQYLERRRAEELAIELARTKDEFIALITHELRNPLAVITSTAALLCEEIPDLPTADQQRYLHIISRSAEQLAVMTNDLLDLSRMESGQLSMCLTVVDLRAVIDQSVQGMHAGILDKHLTVAIDTPRRLTLHADAARLQQVADNIISNAVKYTPAGGTITITATTDTGSHGAEWITWTVSDTGIGIPPAERPRLFRRFYRASTALQRRIPGAGLGLVVSRTIIERHNGTITLGEHQGPGTTFHIRLPRARQPTTPNSTHEAQ